MTTRSPRYYLKGRERLLLSQDQENAQERYMCHPHLRERFSGSLVRAAPGLLERHTAGKGSHEKETSGGDNISPYVLRAIERLLERGHFTRADELFRTHLDDGRVFRSAGRFEEGAKCVLGFVDTARRAQCKAQISEERYVFYLRTAGLFLLCLGRLEEAMEYHRVAAGRSTHTETLKVLLNHSLIWVLTGQPKDGEAVAQAACRLATERNDTEAKQNALCCLAHAFSVQGQISAANERFSEAIALVLQTAPGHGMLVGTDAILWAVHLLRLGMFSEARGLIEGGQRLLEQKSPEGQSDENLPRYLWLLGWIEMEEGNYDRALELLNRAESTFRSQRSLLMLPFVLLSAADVHRRTNDVEKAYRCCAEALELAAARRLLLVQIEARILRARIGLQRLLAESDSTSFEWGYEAADISVEADEALRMARQHGYAWLERDALRVLAEAEDLLGNAGTAKRHRRKAAALCRQLSAGLSEGVA